MNRLMICIALYFALGCAAQYQGEVEYYETPEPETTILIEHYGGYWPISIRGVKRIVIDTDCEVIINGKEATHEDQQEQSSYTSGGADEAQ